MSSIINKEASPSDKLDAILIHIANQPSIWQDQNNSVGGMSIALNNSLTNKPFEYYGLSSYQELAFYVERLLQMKYIKNISNTAFNIQRNGQSAYFPEKIAITFDGLNHIHEIQNKGLLSNKCFVAMQFDRHKDERLDSIQKSCSVYDFDAFIVESYHGIETMTIDAKILSAIKSSKFCIADFSGLNQGAYFEAGYALGRGMKVIFICEQKDFLENKKHFDINHYPFVIYSDFNDLTAKLTNQIGAFIVQ